MNGYDIALAALNLVSVGLEAKDIQARLQTEIDNGTPHESVPALLEKWRDEAIADAESAKPGDPVPAGYKRIGSYERFDGRPSPSDAPAAQQSAETAPSEPAAPTQTASE